MSLRSFWHLWKQAKLPLLQQLEDQRRPFKMSLTSFL
uniref:Uncharacterized protein n=1 Tax=Brassica oleracea TaxID=3712 RepID=A0A3P6FKN6_BRAOL|nr:unnamed protein product [Brassica oleracea]